jgi:hypothetical protein
MHRSTLINISCFMDAIEMSHQQIPSNLIDSTSRFKQEANEQCLTWMKAAPSPLFLDLTSYIHDLSALNPHWVSEEHLSINDTTLEQYISRIACHIIFLPSGSETSTFALVESTGAHIYGKLLYGGVSRCRVLKSGNNVRRVGERREVKSGGNIQQPQLHGGHPSWVQLGGLQRKYEVSQSMKMKNNLNREVNVNGII